MEYKILVSDRSFNALREVQDIAENIRWDYNRVGGCGNFSFDLPIDFCRERFLGGNFNIKISRRNPSTDAFDLWYQGRIEHKIHNVRGDDETISVQGTGYQSELKDIYVDRDYSSKTIEFIVQDILDNDVTPNTNITYDVGDINSATGVTADTLSLNTDALNAFKTLADIVGTREWGVDKDRKFFFKARSSTVGFRFPLGNKLTDWSGDNSSENIVNRVIVIGDGDPPFTRTVNDTQSQNKWGIRTRVIQNTAITTNSVADEFGNALIAESNDVVRRGRVKLLDEQLIENTIPIPLFQLRPKGDTYGTRNYGTGLYNDLINYQIGRISYRLDDVSNLTINMQVGQLRPSISETISQLEFKLDQLQQQGV